MADTTTTPESPAAARAVEREAIALFRAMYPDAPPWQELSDSTRHAWVMYAEKKRTERATR